MAIDSSSGIVRQSLNEFYKEHSFGKEGGLGDFYVKIEVAPGFHFYFPNFESRRKVVTWHDIHHLVSGYEVSLRGESEISAWEIASGCMKYPIVFLINTSGAMFGIPFNFVNVLKAFARGRRTKNLYNRGFQIQEVLNMQVSVLSEELGLIKHAKDSRPSVADFLLFFLFVLFGILYSILILPLLPAIIVYSIYTEVKLRKKSARRSH